MIFGFTRLIYPIVVLTKTSESILFKRRPSFTGSDRNYEFEIYIRLSAIVYHEILNNKRQFVLNSKQIFILLQSIRINEETGVNIPLFYIEK